MVVVVICVGALVWFPQQTSFAPMDVLTGHSSANSNPIQKVAREEGAHLLQSLSLVEKVEPVAVMPEKATESRQLVGGEASSALLLVSLFFLILWWRSASGRLGRFSALAAAGLPAILHCHPRGSAAIFFGVFRL